MDSGVEILDLGFGEDRFGKTLVEMGNQVEATSLLWILYEVDTLVILGLIESCGFSVGSRLWQLVDDGIQIDGFALGDCICEWDKDDDG